MVKATKAFSAVVPGSAYPKAFSTNDDLPPGSVEAKAAFELGLLADADAVGVGVAQGLSNAQTEAAAEKAAAEKAAAEKAADKAQTKPAPKNATKDAPEVQTKSEKDTD